MAKLTIEDIRNPNRKSGFDHVGGAGLRGRPSGGGTGTYKWQASSGTKAHFPGEKTDLWRGPRRTDPAQAAQDYCDYINGQTSPAVRTINKSVGHPRRPRSKSTPEVEAARAVLHEAAKRDPSGWVYVGAETGDDTFTKIGESGSDPIYRLAEGQTWNPRVLKIAASKHVKDRKATERALHATFADLHESGEWFRTSRAARRRIIKAIKEAT